MNRGAIALVLALAALPAVGCGTLVNQTPPGSYLNAHGLMRPNRLYGGVRADGEMLAEAVATVASGESVLSESSVTERDPVTGESVTRDTTPVSTKVREAVTMTLFFALDFPLSFVADTVMLPADIVAQWKRLTAGPEVAEVPKPDETPSPPAKQDTGTNSWQISGRIERPVQKPDPSPDGPAPNEEPAERR